MPRVGLVVVSHSRPLGEALAAMARQVLPPGGDLALQVAAGDVDGGLGTNAEAVAVAVSAADSGAGVVVLMDLGSAVLAAGTALDLLPAEVRERVVLSPGPLVEGLIGAAVVAAGGGDLARVAAEALRGLAPKDALLG